MVYKGFRPDSITRPIFLRGVPQFAKELPLLGTLCAIFLDGIGIPPHKSLTSRFQLACETPDLEESLRELCGQLAQVELSELPADVPKVPDMTPSQIETSSTTNTAPRSSVDNSDVAGFRSPSFVQVPTPESQHHAKPDAPKMDEKSADAVPGESASEDGEDRTTSPPRYLQEQVMLEWDAPEDHVTEAQQAVTVFERSLAAFVERQLRGLYGAAWLRRGCPKDMRERWKEKKESATAIAPASLLGYAEVGELKDVIIRTDNWPAFEPYFRRRDSVTREFSPIIELRNSAMHPSQRDVYLVDQVSALRSMVSLAATYHPPTASRIDDLFRRTISPPAELDLNGGISAAKILSNLADFTDPELVGREAEIEQLEKFWADEYVRAASIVGAGGVGKTALLDCFTYRLLMRPLSGPRPDPEVIIYLTAKDNYLADMRRAPAVQQFKTLRRIYEITLESLGEAPEPSVPIEDLRKSVLSLARSTRIFFALDNLESLDDREYDAVATFINDLPLPSKAILTTRVNRRIGSAKVQLEGLPPADAYELLKARTESHGIVLPNIDDQDVRELLSYTNGFPLTLVYSANAIILGNSVKETLDSMKGRDFLGFLEFSFESSLRVLEPDALQILFYLALSKYDRSRNNLLVFVNESERLSECIRLLLDMSFIRHSSEESKKIKFVIHNQPLRDYVLKRAPEILSAVQYSFVLQRSRMLPSQAESPSVLIEVERALERARSAATYSWQDAISELEVARRTWGDDPRILAQLGYYYFRTEQRATARSLMERAISIGHESAETYTYLALVLYYEKEYDAALQRAEDALSLRPRFPMAEQIAGECLFAKVVKSSLTMDEPTKIRNLQRALQHLRASIISVEKSYRDEAHNQRGTKLIDRIEAEIGSLQSLAKYPSRGLVSQR